MKNRFSLVFTVLWLGTTTQLCAQQAHIDAGPIRASGELAASETSILGPPALRSVWNYTVAFMIPEGTPIKAGMPVLSFDTSELQSRLNDKQGELNTKRSELRRTEVNNQEVLENLQLRNKELTMEANKTALKAELPESVLARNIYQKISYSMSWRNLNATRFLTN